MNRHSADAEIANGSENADVSLDGVKGSSNGNEDAVIKESKDAARALPLWLADATPNDFTVGDWLTQYVMNNTQWYLMIFRLDSCLLNSRDMAFTLEYLS